MQTFHTSYPKDKVNILLLENISKRAVKIFNQAGYANVKTVAGALSEDKLIEEIKNVHIIGVRSKTTITNKILEHAKKLKAIGCFCIGTNQVDLKNATEKGIAVFNAPFSNTRSVAELVIGCSILLIRKIVEKNKKAHEGLWFKEVKDSFELRGKTIGIVGYGNIGMQVSVLAEAMGMNVIYFDITKKLPLGNAQTKDTLQELLQEADIVSLHVPESNGTKNILNAETLPLVKQGAIIINYARGTVVDLDVLTTLIQSGHVGGAAIDVFPVEPEKNGDTFVSPLQNLPNVILTPHIGGSTEEAQENIGADVSSRLLGYLEQGITTGSFTIPELSLPPVEGAHRILHIHKNIPGVLSEINTVLSGNNINVLAQYLKTNERIGYVVLDINQKFTQENFALLKNVKGTLNARVLF